MSIQRYDTSSSDSEAAREKRCWKSVNSPVLSADNKIVFLIHRVDDPTEFVRLQWVERWAV